MAKWGEQRGQGRKGDEEQGTLDLSHTAPGTRHLAPGTRHLAPAN